MVDFKAKGNESYAAGRYKEAVKFYTQGIETCSDDQAKGILYSNRSAAQLAMGHHTEALADAESCIMLRRDWEKGWFRKGAALEELDLLEDALAAYRQCLEISPLSVEAESKAKALKAKLNAQKKEAARQAARRAAEEQREAAWREQQAQPVPASGRKRGPRPAPTRTVYQGPKYQAVLLKAGPFSSKEELMDLIEPFTLTGYGSEARERAQLKGMGWSAEEAGKFYGTTDHDWYFFTYGGQPSRTPNAAMRQATRRAVTGDVVVVKSGPAGGQYDETMAVEEVADAILFYRDRNPSEVFAEREKARVMGGMFAGIDLSGVPHLHFNI